MLVFVVSHGRNVLSLGVSPGHLSVEFSEGVARGGGVMSVCFLSDDEWCCASVSVMLGPVSCSSRSLVCGLMSSLGKDAVRGSEGVACGGGVLSVLCCVFGEWWLLRLVPVLCC